MSEKPPFPPASPIVPLVILVRPQMGENIGAAARAMLNFGISSMRLVAPRDGWPNPKAKAMASGAGVVIDSVRVFDSVADAVADCDHVVATTARQRGLFLPVHTPQEVGPVLRGWSAQGRRSAILFGAEKTGLETDELAMADALITIPVNPAFSSLNLAQAVLLLAYEWSQAGERDPLFTSPYDAAPAPRAAQEGMVEHLFEALDRVGYFYPEARRLTLERNIRTLFTNAKLTEPETRLFRGMVRQMMRHLPDEE
ncbi:MAG: RNA methyltransferase [Pseudomonadota bacterium]